MVRVDIARKAKINPYVFAGTKGDGSETLRVHRGKLLGFDKQRDFLLVSNRMKTAHKLANYFKLPFLEENKAGIIALVCKIAEIAYGTDYLAKTRHKEAIDGRAYISWILRTFFAFTVTEIGVYFGQHHTTIVNLCQRFDGFVTIEKYPEAKLAKILKRVLS